MIYVCSLEEMPEHARRLRPGRIVSILQADLQPPTPDHLAPERHLRVEIDDIVATSPGQVLPSTHHVATLIEFLERRPHDEAILFHCVAGISRSTAAALIALTLDHPGWEHEAADRIRRAAPHAHPNRRIIALADRLLGRGGRLVAAREAMGDGRPALSSPLITLPLLSADRDEVRRRRRRSR